MYLVGFTLEVLKGTSPYIQDGNWRIAFPLCDPLLKTIK
jgi:hypothetical protein